MSSPQMQILKFLEEMKIPIDGHLHDGCNLGNCPYLYIDFTTPEGLQKLADAFIQHLNKQKGGMKCLKVKKRISGLS